VFAYSLRQNCRNSRRTFDACWGDSTTMRNLDEFFEACDRRINRDLIDIGSAAGVVMIVMFFVI